MPSYTRMKRIFLEGLLWLFLLQYRLMALSLEPGFLDFDNLPDTNFTCVGKVIGGYYADLETNCQMFHVCTIGQADEPMDIRFLCLNGTVFDQETRVCERIDEVDCSKSEKFYSLNLELYGNSGPILEETPEVPQETEPPSLIIKSTTSTTTTTTTTQPSNPQYFTTIRPSTATTPINKGHHFPVNPDIRFNPEEINISLNAGAPPDIRTKHYQPHQSFSESDKRLTQTDNDEEQSVRVQKPERTHTVASTSPKSIYAIDSSDSDRSPQNSDDSFGFPDDFLGTELPPRQQQFLIQTNSFRHSQSFPPNLNHRNANNQYHHPQFHSTTVKQHTNFHQNPSHTTLRTIYLQSLKPPQIHQHHHYTHHPRTEKTPQRVQIPIPVLPTLPPLTFSSPAPFSLQRHIETKRYTKDHQAPPRIIISASASVSDASGRRLNYSLGTIGAAQILQSPPSSYDDYKDGDVGLDPFYHDVPRVKQRRRRKRRSAEPQTVNPFDIIKNEKEAVDVLKFLFTWYQSHQATATVPAVTSPVSPELIKKINDELAPAVEDSFLKTDSSEVHFTNSKEPTSTESLKPSELFTKSSRFSIVGGHRNDNPNSGASAIIQDSDKELLNKLKDLEPILRNEESSSQADTAIFKEKMDDADTTILKDTKESPFNPDDYVDDNYEAVVYKANATTEKIDVQAPATTETNQEVTKKEEPFVDPAAVEELYKYFSINDHFVTSTTVSQSSKAADVSSSPESGGRHTEINVLSEVHEDDGLSRSSSTTTTTVAPPRYTARRRGKSRPSSEGYQEKNSWKSLNKRGRSRGRSRFTNPYGLSSTTPASSTIALKESASETVSEEISNILSTSPLYESEFKILTEVTSELPEVSKVSPTEQTEKNDDEVEESITNRPSEADLEFNKNEKNEETKKDDGLEHQPHESNFEFNKDEHEKDEEVHASKVEDHPQENSFEIRENGPEKSYDVDDPKVHRHESNFESETEIKKTEETHATASEHHPHESNFESETEKTEEAHATATELHPHQSNFDYNKTESEDVHAPIVESVEREALNTSPDQNHMIEDKTVKDNEITNSNTGTTEPATQPSPSNETRDVSDAKATPELAVSDDPSYLVKLLKFYAEDAMNMHQPLTTTPEASYHPVTEYQTTTSIPHSVEPRRNRLRSKHRHSSRVSTTDLPTLGDIHEGSNEQPLNNDEGLKTTDIPNEKLEEGRHIKSKSDLLEKLSLIEQNLAVQLSVTNTPIDDTTLTTPLVSFEERESFGTTLASATDPTKSVDHTTTSQELPKRFTVIDEHTTASQELTKMFEVNTEPGSRDDKLANDSFYDDLFVVPELTERSLHHHEGVKSETSTTGFTIEVPETTTPLIVTESSRQEKSDSDAISTVATESTTEHFKNEEPLGTTAPPDVEIQKSISLPISVLDFNVPADVNSAHDINSLISNDGADVSTVPSTNPTAETDNTKSTYDNTVPVTLITTEMLLNDSSTPKYIEEHLHRTVMPEVRQNATEIIFIKNVSTRKPVESPGMVNSSHLLQVVVENVTDQPVTISTTSTAPTSRPYHVRKTRPPRRKPYKYSRNEFGRHRFNTELSTVKPIKSEAVRFNQNLQTSNETITDAPLHRSATPTRSELKKVLLHTTPLSKNGRPPTKVGRFYVFNCFGKDTNRFYADPRDCRLFHYCTRGYSKNQLLDLKYVCDQKTFFDEDQLTCTTTKPARCV